ncbi:hypothetical protein SIO70_03760 [Chitinophaga sancti]|uniref:hypothetical protein n=1 Tax=Chitinophaga sancti TaxID=1004 RepID=UPI002A754812|nr:hypothetical protein [Chitinophaga sancti]WPQ63975.1 hypothetical protein SIO70_03760 [Chitinophaga sancti]
MTRLLFFISIIVMCASCGSGGSGNFKDSTTTLIITDTCAVIFHPAGDKLTYLKNTFNKNSFAAMEQSNNAALVADSAYLAKLGVKIISTSKLKLKFHKKNGEDVDINLMHEKYAWEVFLFDSYNDPVKADITDIETAVQEAGIR